MIILIFLILLSYASFINEVPSVSNPFSPAPAPSNLTTNFSQFYPNCTYGGTQTWAGRTIHIYNNCGTVPVVPVRLHPINLIPHSYNLSTLPSSLSDNNVGLFNVSGTVYLLITRSGNTGGAFSFNLSRGNSIRVYTCGSCNNIYLLIYQFNSSVSEYGLFMDISRLYIDRQNIPGYISPLSLSVDRTFLNESTYIFYSSFSPSVGTLVFFKHPNYSTSLFTDIIHFPNENFMAIVYPGAVSNGSINRSFAPIYLPGSYLIGTNASNYITFSHQSGFLYVNYRVNNITYNVTFLNDFWKVAERQTAIMNITVSNRSAFTSSPVERNYTVYDYISTVTFRLNTSLFPYPEVTVPAEFLPRPVSGSCGSVSGAWLYYNSTLNGSFQICGVGSNLFSNNQIYNYLGRRSIIHLPGIMELVSASNTNVSFVFFNSKRYYLNFSSPVECGKHKIILYYPTKDIFYGSTYDYEVLTRSIDRIYLDYRPVSGVVYIQFPRVNKVITNYELQNYLLMFPSFTITNYSSFGDHICNFTIASISAELPLFSNISGVNRSNFFNIGEPNYTFSDGEGNYSCRYVSGNLYCFSRRIASEFEPYTSYFNASYISSGLIDIVSKADFLRCIISQYNDSHKILKFVGLFKVPINFSIVVRNGSVVDSMYNYTNVSNISATIFFRANQKAEVLSDGVSLCKSYGFFDQLSNIPVVFPFFALIVIGLATVAVTNILSLIGVAYLLIEGGIFLGVGVNVIAFVIALFFAVYLLINKPTEDSVRTAVTLGIALFFALNELVKTVPEIYDINNSYFSSVGATIANKTASLQRLTSGGWDSLEFVNIPGEVAAILLIPFDLLFGLPLLVRDIVNAFWFPVGYYVAQLGIILITLAVMNLTLRIIEILLNRFRKL